MSKVFLWIVEPSRFKKINGYAVIFFLLLVPVSWYLDWLSKVEYVSALSIYALVAAHLSTWQAARVEVEQDRQAKQLQDQEEADMRVIQQKVEELHNILLNGGSSSGKT
jgi:hypothetical protein